MDFNVVEKARELIAEHGYADPKMLQEKTKLPEFAVKAALKKAGFKEEDGKFGEGDDNA